MSNWFYRKSGQDFGPIPSSALKQLAAIGQLSPGDAVRREDMEKWTTARKVQGLFAEGSEVQARPPSTQASARVMPVTRSESTVAVATSTSKRFLTKPK